MNSSFCREKIFCHQQRMFLKVPLPVRKGMCVFKVRNSHLECLFLFFLNMYVRYKIASFSPPSDAIWKSHHSPSFVSLESYHVAAGCTSLVPSSFIIAATPSETRDRWRRLCADTDDLWIFLEPLYLRLSVRDIRLPDVSSLLTALVDCYQIGVLLCL